MVKKAFVSYLFRASFNGPSRNSQLTLNSRWILAWHLSSNAGFKRACWRPVTNSEAPIPESGLYLVDVDGAVLTYPGSCSKRRPRNFTVSRASRGGHALLGMIGSGKSLLLKHSDVLVEEVEIIKVVEPIGVLKVFSTLGFLAKDAIERVCEIGWARTESTSLRRLCLLPSAPSERRDFSSSARNAHQRRMDDGRHDSWQSNFERLAQYVKEQQQTNSAAASDAPAGNAAPSRRDNPSLRAWLDKQRHSLRQKKRQLRERSLDETSPELPAEVQDRIQKLESLGYKLSPREDNWESKFQQLLDFVKERGFFPYECPSGDLMSPNDRSLLWWCRLQRRSYKRFAHENEQDQQAEAGAKLTGTLNKGVKSVCASRHALLAKERQAKLESIGFLFDPFEETWNQRYKELTAYCHHHGNCRVPTDYPANPRLAVWVGEQRYHYKKFREKRPSSMSGHRIELLRELGFEWNVFDAQWNDKYERLRDHVRMNGPGSIVATTRHDRELQNWIKQQLKLYRAKSRGASNSLTDDREAKLRTMGFPWQSRGHSDQR